MKKKKILKKIKDNYLIIFLLFIAISVNVLALVNLGIKYNLDSDDVGYIKSGIIFYKSHKITMHGVVSAQIMPGMTFLISLFVLFFKSGSALYLSLKIFWISMGIMTIYFTYKTILLLTENKFISSLCCLFFLSLDYVHINNVMLTETPFILLFVLLIYTSLLLEKTGKDKYFYLIILFYIIALFIRPNIFIWPLALVIYLIIKKYDYKRLIKQLIIAMVVTILVLIPWWYRNYKVFDSFVPLTYGSGNPLLLGTYQGYNFPNDNELNYKKDLVDKLPKKKKEILYQTEASKMKKYYSLEFDGIKAKYRMKHWWQKDREAMIISYTIYKPLILFKDIFYGKEIFHIKIKVLKLIRLTELILFILSTIIILVNKYMRKELIYLLIILFSQVAIYSYTFCYSRYGISLCFLRYIIIGIGLNSLYLRYSKGKGLKS